jgi:hypothetical protein
MKKAVHGSAADQKLFDNNRIGEILFVGALFIRFVFFQSNWGQNCIGKRCISTKKHFALPLASRCFISCMFAMFHKTRRDEEIAAEVFATNRKSNCKSSEGSRNSENCCCKVDEKCEKLLLKLRRRVCRKTFDPIISVIVS